jgi:hypothetical protein
MQLLTPLLCGAGVLSHAPRAAAEGGVTHGHEGGGAHEHEPGHHAHTLCAEVSAYAAPTVLRPAEAQGRIGAGAAEPLPTPVYEVPPPIPI